MEPENASSFFQDDWWQQPDVVSILYQQFKTHILGLLISGFSDTSDYEFYTGFLFRHREHLFWLTAGHIIDKIEFILSKKREKLIMRWFDGYPNENAGAIPINITSMKMKSWNKQNLDAGVIKLGYLEEQDLLANNSITPLDARIYLHKETAKPDGYFLIGFPRKYNQYHEKPFRNNKTKKSLRSDYACIPVEKIPIPIEDANLDFFNKPDAFYGQLLDEQLDPDNYLGSINYMSGSPIFSIERTKEGKFVYRLFGIQTKWLPESRRICAEPINKIINEFEMWLDENRLNE